MNYLLAAFAHITLLVTVALLKVATLRAVELVLIRVGLDIARPGQCSTDVQEGVASFHLERTDGSIVDHSRR